ncbi:MAG: bifunctional demethylmenaquinone methyltransferase/2-methoxy-6-polyprenyl-1,4-benzoquinol methylase UbiE [Waddliaceae bacterium]
MTNRQEKDPNNIKEMFGHIAKHYDRANAVMSLNFHHFWNRKLIQSVLSCHVPKRYLDLCCGTGEIALGLLDASLGPCEAFLLDFCPEMLVYAEEKARKKGKTLHQIHYLQADAQEIPLPSESIDAVTIAYGIRNVADPFRCCQEVLRVLRPGGCFGVLELTRPENPLLKWGHQVYLRGFLPIVGKWIASNPSAYHYLRRSIHSFIPPKELENVLTKSGFAKVERHALCGGTATRLLALKK